MKHAKLLFQLTTLALVLLSLAVVLAGVIGTIASMNGVEAGLELPISFTPDRNAYSLTSESWGDGEIETAVGQARFEDAPTGGFVVLAIVGIAVFIIPAFVVLILLRRIFGTMVGGAPFAEANVRRIRWIGALVIIFLLLEQLAELGVGMFVDSQVTATGLHVGFDFDLDLSVVFLGLVIVGLAEVFRYGSRLQTESDLTV